MKLRMCDYFSYSRLGILAKDLALAFDYLKGNQVKRFRSEYHRQMERLDFKERAQIRTF